MCPFLTMPDLAAVTHALIASWLDYCNELYVALPVESVRKLQEVQNAAVGLLTTLGYRDHIPPPPFTTAPLAADPFRGTIQSAGFNL